MTSTPASQPDSVARPSLLTIAFIFLRLGATAFGGPAAHIALMEDEFVRRRRWLSREQFLDLLGAANLIPGPNSTEVAIHIGHTQAGLPGLLTAGICFIAPAAVMVSIIAALYLKFVSLPVTEAIFYGLKPVIIAIVFQALWGLCQTALKTRLLAVSAVLVAILYLRGVNEIVLLFGSGLVAAAAHYAQSKEPKETGVLMGLALVSTALIAFAAALSTNTPKNLPYSLAALFFYFLKIGSVLYGSGYVLLAFLRSDLVENYHWITSAQLLDATAVGQITPGPVFTTATFIGYILGGSLGAVIATAGIFLPAFVLVALSGPIVRGMRKSELAGNFLNAVNAAAVALMGGVLLQLGRDAFVDTAAVLIALISGILLIRFRRNSMWLMLSGAICGLVVHGSR